MQNVPGPKTYRYIFKSSSECITVQCTKTLECDTDYRNNLLILRCARLL